MVHIPKPMYKFSFDLLEEDAVALGEQAGIEGCTKKEIIVKALNEYITNFRKRFEENPDDNR